MVHPEQSFLRNYHSSDRVFSLERGKEGTPLDGTDPMIAVSPVSLQLLKTKCLEHIIGYLREQKWLRL